MGLKLLILLPLFGFFMIKVATLHLAHRTVNPSILLPYNINLNHNQQTSEQIQHTLVKLIVQTSQTWRLTSRTVVQHLLNL